jgi:peptidyl-prolyl cis-trans isomerase A (cyclophilin A)
MTDVIMETSMGSITVALDEAKAPTTSANFLAYVDAGFFDNTIFHRVIPNFVIQGGGFGANMERKATQPSIQNEAANGLKNLRGTLSMARTSDPGSATSQFFVNLRDNRSLDFSPANPGYAVFAKVTAGMDVVDRIAGVKTATKGMYEDVPVAPVVVLSARRAEGKA